MKLSIRRIYGDSPKENEYRILVDRIWPRGISKDKAQLDEWLKEIAPSTELRKWFNHQEEKFEDFKKKYKVELKDQQEAIAVIQKKLQSQNVVLLYGAKDEKHNQAIVLKEIIENM